jgi:NADPH:quinone reductase-like Zn-dependent oxidoreductase
VVQAKNPGISRVFDRAKNMLLDGNFSAACAFAAEKAELAAGEGYDTVFSCVNSEITAGESTVATTLGAAGLTNDNLAGLNFLATKNLNTKALAWAVMYVFGCTACFDV